LNGWQRILTICQDETETHIADLWILEQVVSLVPCGYGIYLDSRSSWLDSFSMVVSVFDGERQGFAL